MHHFNDEWYAKISVNRRAISEYDKLFYVSSNPVRGAPDGIDYGDPADPNDTQAVFSYPGAFGGETRNLTQPQLLARALEALRLGASLQYQGRIYLEPGTLSSTTGEPVRITQKGYALLDLLAR